MVVQSIGRSGNIRGLIDGKEVRESLSVHYYEVLGYVRPNDTTISVVGVEPICKYIQKYNQGLSTAQIPENERLRTHAGKYSEYVAIPAVDAWWFAGTQEDTSGEETVTARLYVYALSTFLRWAQRRIPPRSNGNRRFRVFISRLSR